MGIITKGKIGRQDINAWGGGATKTFNRATSAGGLETMTYVGDVVDMLAAYGGGTAYDYATLAAAVSAVGSNVCCLAVAPGTWDIDQDITIPANVTLWFPAGAVFEVAAGKTVTCNGYVLAEPNRQIFTGSGTFTLTTYPQQDGWWGNTAALILTTGSGALKIAQSGLVTAAGDMLYFNGTNLVKLAKGTAGHYLKQGAAAPEWAALGAPAAHASTHITAGSDEIDGDKLDIDWNPTYYTPATVTETTSVDNLSSHLKGIDNALAAGTVSGAISFKSARDTDTDHDINITALHCRDYADTCDIIIADITKQIDAVWAAGDDAGGLADSLTLSNATWYHVIAVAKAAGADPDVVFDTDLTAANHRAANADHTKYRYLFSVLTDGSANILAYTQIQDTFLWSDPPQDVDVSNFGTAASLYTLSVPPGVSVEIILDAIVFKSGDTAYTYLSSPYANDEAPNVTTGPVTIIPATTTDKGYVSNLKIWTNTSAQIRGRCQTATTDLNITTLGWRLPMGTRVGI